MINFANAIKHDWMGRTIDLWLAEKRGGETFAVTLLTMEQIKDGAILPECPLKLEPNTAQQLMDSLWECGLRPSEGSGSAGALAATQRHLEDMRTLVFKKGETQ